MVNHYYIRVVMEKRGEFDHNMDIKHNFINKELREQFLRQFYLFYIMEPFHTIFKENIEYSVSNLLDDLKKLETETLRELLKNKIQPVAEIYNYNVTYSDDFIIDEGNSNYFNILSHSDQDNRLKEQEKKDADKNVNN